LTKIGKKIEKKSKKKKKKKRKKSFRKKEMPHSFGYRARTRYMFSRDFRAHGPTHLSDYMQVYKVGDYVDVVCNASIHKGMPHKFYHGKTGRVWNITPRAIGVEINKQVGNRIIKKRIHVRVEHVRKSKCQDDFKARMRACSQYAQARAADPSLPKLTFKRLPEQPREGAIVKVKAVVNVTPAEYSFVI
jgi:large subunit ribosomal protein L21e